MDNVTYETMDWIHKVMHLNRMVLQKESAMTQLHFGQLPVLEYIMKHDGCTQVELAEEMMVSPASVALSTKRLEKAGLLVKKIDPSNLRCKHLFATDKGREMALKCHEAYQALAKQMFQSFDRQELEQMVSYLKRMARNLLEGIHPEPDQPDCGYSE